MKTEVHTVKPLPTETVETVYRLEPGARLPFPLFIARIPAGGPSPADDYIDRVLDLNELLIQHPAATFFVRVSGDSMIGAGIHPGDILIVDRAEEAADGSIIIAALDGELTVKRIRRERDRIMLVPENPGYAPLRVTPETQFQVWGVVMHVIHTVRPGRGEGR